MITDSCCIIQITWIATSSCNWPHIDAASHEEDTFIAANDRAPKLKRLKIMQL